MNEAELMVATLRRTEQAMAPRKTPPNPLDVEVRMIKEIEFRWTQAHRHTAHGTHYPDPGTARPVLVSAGHYEIPLDQFADPERDCDEDMIEAVAETILAGYLVAERDLVQMHWAPCVGGDTVILAFDRRCDGECPPLCHDCQGEEDQT